MSTLPEKSRQIVQAHAALTHAVVMACHNRDLLPQLEPVLAASEASGWHDLVRVVRLIVAGRREASLLNGLDEEDGVIVGAILGGLQNPGTLPDPEAKPEARFAAPGLAHLIHAAGKGDVQALQHLAAMAEQMTRAGGDMARLGAVLHRLTRGERDMDTLSAGMGSRGKQLILSLLAELAQHDVH
jgi:hypothetical protein